MEYLDLVDENNVLTGKKEERGMIHEKGLWHREVSAWIINEKREVLIQKRAATKKQEPNKWAVCAGHIDAGETVEISVIRELKEELGYEATIDELELISVEKKDNVFPNGIINNNFQYIYLLRTNKKIEEYKIQYEELSELKYISFEEFENAVKNKDPNMTFTKQPYMIRLIEEFRKRI